MDPNQVPHDKPNHPGPARKLSTPNSPSPSPARSTGDRRFMKFKVHQNTYNGNTLRLSSPKRAPPAEEPNKLGVRCVGESSNHCSRKLGSSYSKYEQFNIFFVSSLHII